jgi:predicted metalloprotease with PDZ domain
MRRTVFFTPFALLFATDLPAKTPDATACDLEYNVEAKWDETPRRFEVRLAFSADEQGQATLIGPKSWGGVDDFDTTIRDMRVTSDKWSLKAVESNQWLVAAPKDSRVTLSYSIVNGVTNIDDESPISHRDFHRNTLGKDHFQLIGHGAFVLPKHLTGQLTSDKPPTTCITFAGLPKSWTFASSFNLGQQAGTSTIRVAGKPEQIGGALFLGGDYRIQRRELDGAPLFIALRGQWSFSDEAFADATASLVRTQRRFWNDFDFPHYVIALAPNRVVRGSSNGGTGLRNAFTMHASANFRVPGSEFNFLIGHEHLHTWIPQRIGTMGSDSQPLRYWFSEGFTNYLTHRLLLQSGVWTLDQYAARINDVIASYLTSRDINASNERVLREYWSNRNSVGNLPYQRGELLALRWATRLAARGKSIERHLQALAVKADQMPDRGSKKPEDLAVTRLRNALRADLGDAVDADIEQFIERGDTMAMDETFLGPCFGATFQERALYELGFDSVKSFADRRVAGVVAGSRADQAGLRDGMEMKGWSASIGDASHEATVTVVDNGALREIRFFPASAKTVLLPVYAAKTSAATSPDCLSWLPAQATEPSQSPPHGTPSR